MEATSPFGFTSSNAVMVSTVNPNWFVFHEYPPPRLNPATPTPETRPPTTFTPSGASAVYTSSQIRPVPMVAVPLAASYVTPENRVIEMCTPVVEEKPGFAVCPPPLTANGVFVEPRSWITIETSAAVPGSTAQAAICVLEDAQWAISAS